MKPDEVPQYLVTEFRRAEVMAALDVANGADSIRAFLARFLPEVERGVRAQIGNGIEAEKVRVRAEWRQRQGDPDALHEAACVIDGLLLAQKVARGEAP